MSFALEQEVGNTEDYVQSNFNGSNILSLRNMETCCRYGTCSSSHRGLIIAPGLDANGDITKTRLYNFDPLKTHFYIVKLGFAGVYIIFLISAQKHRLWVLVRTASSRRF